MAWRWYGNWYLKRNQIRALEKEGDSLFAHVGGPLRVPIPKGEEAGLIEWLNACAEGDEPDAGSEVVGPSLMPDPRTGEAPHRG